MKPVMVGRKRYATLSLAADALGVHRSQLCHALKEGRDIVKGKRVRYAKEER